MRQGVLLSSCFTCPACVTPASLPTALPPTSFLFYTPAYYLPTMPSPAHHHLPCLPLTPSLPPYLSYLVSAAVHSLQPWHERFLYNICHVPSHASPDSLFSIVAATFSCTFLCATAAGTLLDVSPQPPKHTRARACFCMVGFGSTSQNEHSTILTL